MRRLLARWLAAVCALASCAAGHAAPILGAGGPEHAWVALQSVWRPDNGWTLYHSPASIEPGGVLRVRSLASRPERLAASGDSLYLVYGPTRGQSSDERVRQVRAIAAIDQVEGTRFRYEPSTRERVLPPLPGWGALLGVTANRSGAFALLRERDRLGLFRLDATAWSEHPLPPEIETDATWRLAPSEQGPALLVSTESGTRLWTRSDDGSGWQSEPVAPAIGDWIVRAADQLITGARADEGEVALTVLRQGQAHPLGTVAGVPEDHAVAALGDAVLLAWLNPEDETRLQVAVVSAISGQVLHEGPAIMQPVLTPHDLQYLALLLTAVLLMVLIFVLRPESGPGLEVDLPERLTPASEIRRLLAAVLDLLPVAAASSALWQSPFVTALGLQIDVSGSGVWPLLTTLGAATVIQSACEWLLGWTPGKWLCGLRTVSRSGERIALRQAIVRNVVKFACPPLLALILADPARRHPGDYFAGSVVVMRAPEPGDDDDASDATRE